MKTYVCGFMKDSRDRIALVRKNKPAWQAGRLNGIGGGIEEDETAYEAMVREWYEETGTFSDSWEHFAKLTFADAEITFFKVSVAKLPAFPSHNDIGEAIEIWDYSIVVRKDSDVMLQNLKWLLPLAFEDPDGLKVVSFHHAKDSGPLRAENDNECFTLPNGDCIAKNCCLHSVAA